MMDRPEQLRDLYTKIAEAHKQVVMLMNEESNLGTVTDTRLRGFIIDNRPFPNSTEEWSDGLRAICDILSIIYSDRFDEVLNPNNLGLRRYWFSKDPDIQFTAQDKTPYKIRNTGIFVDTFGDNERKKVLIERLSALFGCQIYLDYYKP